MAASFRTLSINMGTREKLRIRRATATPLIPGIIKSSMIKSGVSFLTSASIGGPE
jgi:hypothetical protein